MKNPFEIFTQKPDKAPFKEWKRSNLQGGSATFFELPEFPDLVIRKSQSFEVKEGGKKLTVAETVKYWSERAKALQRFADRYGIKIAKTRYFAGNDPYFKSAISKESCPAFMSATDKISGKNLEEISEVDDKMAVEIDTMFSGIFSGLYDSLNESGYYWTDYGNSQVMYGIAPNEKESHVYIIDTDPRMEKWNELPQRKEYAFWNEINWVYDEMSSIEYKYMHGTKQFENARKALVNIIEKMPIPTNETAIDLRGQLIEKMKT
jgi:hypothetical protein